MTDLDDTEQALVESLRRWLSDHVDTATQARADLPPAPPVWRGLADDLGLLGARPARSRGWPGGGLRAQLLGCRRPGRGAGGRALPWRRRRRWAAPRCRPQASPLLAALVRVTCCRPGILLSPARAAWTTRCPPRCSPRARAGGCTAASSGVVAAAQANPRHRHRHAARPAHGGVCRRPCRRHHAARTRARWTAAARRNCSSTTRRCQPTRAWAAPTCCSGCRTWRAPGLCAESLGVTKKLIDDTCEAPAHALAVGQPLASQQVPQHRLADMHIARLQAQALTRAVVAGVDAATADERALAVSSAEGRGGACMPCRRPGGGAVAWRHGCHRRGRRGPLVPPCHGRSRRCAAAARSTCAESTPC